MSTLWRHRIVFFVIIVVAVFFRFYRYEERWGLAHDQAAFAITGRYALSKHVLPLMGPFSSGGPFQTSGTWYWFVMIGTAIFPSIV